MSAQKGNFYLNKKGILYEYPFIFAEEAKGKILCELIYNKGKLKILLAFQFIVCYKRCRMRCFHA